MFTSTDRNRVAKALPREESAIGKKICSVALTVGLFAAMAFAPALHARQPNILLILADDVGREVLGCYGGASYPTPRIDRLAAEGRRFEHAYVMPVCHTTRTTLLTGRYPFQLGHPAWGSFPREAEGGALPNLLKRAGYRTAIAGKWQLALLGDNVNQPHRLGFDEYCLYGWHEGPWYYQPHIRENGKLRTDVRNRYGPDVMCDFLINFIERSPTQPFFAFYSMSLCHAETNDLDQPAPFGPNGRYDSYAEMVPKMDERVGRVLEALDRAGERENTLILFLSDNGTPAKNLIDFKDGEYVYENVVSKIGDREVAGGKGTLTDGGVRVPLIANWPGKINPGDVSAALVDASDVLPTLVDVAGAAAPVGVELSGRSLALHNPDEATAERSWVFAEHQGECMVRDKRWKVYRDGRFYDTEVDPAEQHSLPANALTSEAASKRRRLQQALLELGYNPPPE